MNTGRSTPRNTSEAITRTLRHEVGDLLQTLYATVAILQRRLPADWAQERRVLTDLRSRAETCKNVLDIAHDYACPINLNYAPVDLGELAARLVAAAAGRFPRLEIELASTSPCSLGGDEARLSQVGEILLHQACESARQRVTMEVSCPSPKADVTWSVTDDGPGLFPEELEQAFMPYAITRQGRPGLGLALARKLVALHGGEIGAENLAGDKGLRVHLRLPYTPPDLHGNGQSREVVDRESEQV
jgi:signal transduction histidine kinase